MPKFEINSAYKPVADQPARVAGLAQGIEDGDRFQTLLGVTGSGKTATMAFTIEQVQRPALVIAHNKTLAAQLCNEFREFFPDNSVEYFVSYYDYYQPEAYVPAQDLYIEKDSSINEEIDRLRHAATSALFARRDVIVVASRVLHLRPRLAGRSTTPRCMLLKKGEMVDRDEVLRKLVDNQYTRNDQALGRGTFRVRGETLEVFPAYAETAYRAVFFGDEIEAIQHFDPLTGEVFEELEHAGIWPATHYATDRPTIERAVGRDPRRAGGALRKELEEQGKLLESHRLRQRTQFDMEMLRELGFCNGIENYSRILDGRAPGERPFCLLDFFPDDFVCFIDESHQTVPQIGGMFEGDRSRKTTLVEYGFRLPSALDNRPQTFDEFLQHTPQIVFVSATPGDFERNHSSRIVEQIVRPTGVVDPEVDVRETKNQIDDLMKEIRAARRGRGAHARHDAHEEDGRGPDRLPARVRLQGPLPALGDRHARADPDHPRAAARRVRRAGGREPAARGPRPARGVARGDPRRRQGGLPPRRDVADPDDRPRRPQHPRQGDHVRRQGDGGDAQRRSGRRIAAARSRSPTTRSTASRRRRSRRASPTSPTS